MIKKYKWKCRLLVINITTFSDQVYKYKKIYQKKIKEFHKRSIKFLTNKTKNKSYSIDLIGFDGQKKGTFKYLNFKKIFNIIDKMPISKSMALKKLSQLICLCIQITILRPQHKDWDLKIKKKLCLL